MSIEKKEKISVFFKYLGKIFKADGEKGMSLLDVAHEKNIPLEGACEGNLACSTCHVICEKDVYDPAEISEREDDMLDQAYGLRPTSRLGCQIKLDSKHNLKTFEIPKYTRNI